MDTLTFQDAKAHVKHLILPGFENDRCPIIFEEETIAEFLERSRWEFKLPTICVMNGQPVMRSAWATTTISSSDRVEFFSRPYGSGTGGGNKTRTVLSLVALVAIAAFAPWAAGPAGLALTGFSYYATVAAITIAGGFLVSTFLSPKAADNDGDKPNQLYSLQGGGNVAIPFQTIPVQYGRLKVEPAYAAIPWQEYIGDDAYLNILLCNGLGKYEREQILIDDTILWDSTTGLSSSFTDVTWQFCDPGEAFTLFPSNVIISTEVNGQEIIGPSDPIGWYIVNASGTTATELAFDFILPAGLYGTDGDGDPVVLTVHLIAEIQQVNDVGTPIGTITTVINEYITLYTKDPRRWTEKITLSLYGLPPGRYQGRVWRDPASTGADYNVDTLNWLGFRAYLQGSNTFDDVSVTGIRIKATSQLSNSSAKKIGIIQTRILPVWDGAEMVEEPTQNAWWAFYDAATNSSYGAQWPTNKIDFQTIVDQATAADTRGDSFNYTFTSAVTYQSALDLILASNRSKVTWLGDVLSAVRDEWKPIPQMLISDQQIVRGSMEIDYILNDESSSDSVRGQFLNEETWSPAELQYPPNSESFTALAPASTQIEGITNPDQLYNELKFLYKQSQLRRIRIKLDTEHDGRLLRFGSAVKIQSHLPKKWGASGEVLSYNSGTKILTLSRDLTIVTGQHYIEMRDKVGGYFGPVKCSIVVGHLNQVLLDSTDLAEVEFDLSTTIDAALDRMDGAEPPSFVYGLAANLSRNCLVLSGRPSDHRVALELTVDSEEVHDDTGPDIPVLPTAPSLRNPKVPIISGLVASIPQNVAEPLLKASWWPAAGALYYKAQISYDAGLSWITVKDNEVEPNLSAVVAPTNLRLRVAGINQIQGPWSVIEVIAPDITNPFITSPADLEAGLADYVMNQLKAGADEANRIRQIMASAAAEQDAAQALELIKNNTNKKVLHEWLQADYNEKVDTLRSEVVAGDLSLAADITTTQTTIADAIAAQATINTSVNASLTSLTTGLATANANITTNANAIVTTNAALASLSTSVTASFASTNANVAANTAAITAESTARANADTAIASSVTTLTATVGTNTADITTNASAIATTNGVVAAMYTLTLDVNDYISGFASTNDGAFSTFTIISDVFKVAKPGVSGGAAITIFQVAAVAGVAKIAFKGDMFADGTITATALSVSTLSAITANIGAVTAGTITSANAKMLIDLNNNKILISD